MHAMKAYGEVELEDGDLNFAGDKLQVTMEQQPVKITHIYYGYRKHTKILNGITYRPI